MHCDNCKNLYEAAKSGHVPCVKHFFETAPKQIRCDTLHYALQHGQTNAAAYIMGDELVSDKHVLLSAVLSGNIPTIELVIARWSKETPLDHRCIFIACAKGDVRREVWELCMERFPCHDLSTALRCSLMYDTHTATDYLLNTLQHRVPEEAKLWCKNVEQLKMIHAKNESWPKNFLCEIDDKEMCEFYKKRKLMEMMGVIDDMNIPEGDYLKLCNLMKEMHDAL